MLAIDESKPINQTELAVKKLVALLFADIGAGAGKDYLDVLFQRVALKVLYEQLLECDFEKNPKSEVIVVRILRPRETKKNR